MESRASLLIPPMASLSRVASTEPPWEHFPFGFRLKMSTPALKIATGQTLADVVVASTDSISTRTTTRTRSNSRASELTGIENMDSEIWLRLTIVQLDPIGMRIEI